MHRLRLLGAILAVGTFELLGRFLARRYPQWFDPVVQCKQGHRYRSIWVPGGSLKALRWFTRRLQWCPVGRHWSWTRRLDLHRLSPDELAAASAVHDLPIA